MGATYHLDSDSLGGLLTSAPVGPDSWREKVKRFCERFQNPQPGTRARFESLKRRYGNGTSTYTMLVPWLNSLAGEQRRVRCLSFEACSQPQTGKILHPR